MAGDHGWARSWLHRHRRPACARRRGGHLRWFITSDEILGKGIGTLLVSSAMDLCWAKGYNHIYLWTITGLDAARHLYEKFGFELVLQVRGS